MVQFDAFWSVFCYNFVKKNIVKIFIFINIKDIVLLRTIFRGTLEHTSQNVCLLCHLVHFGLHFLRTLSEANIYEYLSSIFFAHFSACGRPFLYLWGAFFGFPPPEQNFLRALMNIWWYCCALDKVWRLMPPPPRENCYKIARLEYIFDRISAFAKYSWGMHSRETLFKWCNLVCFRV